MAAVSRSPFGLLVSHQCLQWDAVELFGFLQVEQDGRNKLDHTQQLGKLQGSSAVYGKQHRRVLGQKNVSHSLLYLPNHGSYNSAME